MDKKFHSETKSKKKTSRLTKNNLFNSPDLFLIVCLPKIASPKAKN